MSIPKDGYYIARVQLDTGGQWELYVRIKDGKPHTTLGVELLPEACSEFQEVSTSQMARAWPDDAAMELEALRTANAGLVEEIDRLEEALASIRDYWNRDQNEKAMADACWNAIETESDALGEKGNG